MREPSQGLQAGVSGNRHSVLHEGEGGNAAPVFAGEASDVLDRPRCGDDAQVAVPLERARRKPLPGRVILSGRRTGIDGSPQERIVAGNGEVEDRRRDRQNGDRHQTESSPTPFDLGRVQTPVDPGNS